MFTFVLAERWRKVGLCKGLVLGPLRRRHGRSAQSSGYSVAAADYRRFDPWADRPSTRRGLSSIRPASSRSLFVKAGRLWRFSAFSMMTADFRPGPTAELPLSRCASLSLEGVESGPIPVHLAATGHHDGSIGHPRKLPLSPWLQARKIDYLAIETT